MAYHQLQESALSGTIGTHDAKNFAGMYGEVYAFKHRMCAEAILKNAPSADDGYFVVPKIVE